MKFPVLTIVTPTYNVADYLPRFFASLEKQTIDFSSIEILIIDGGSTDGTRAFVKDRHVRVIDNPKKLAEPGVVMGFEQARGDLVMILAVDNIFKTDTALKTIIDIFKNQNISAAFPKHDTASDDSIYSRYFNTFTDPFTHFVYGKAANARTFSSIYKTITHNKIYDVYDYTSGTSGYPLLALAQGFTIRKNAIPKRFDEQYDDVLTIYTLIKQGRNIAYAYNVSLYHYTIRNLGDFIKKQRRAVENALVRGNSGISQRTQFLTLWQKIKQYLFFPYALTLVVPLLQSLINIVRTGEMTWLIHPFMSFISSVILIVSAVPRMIRRGI